MDPTKGILIKTFGNIADADLAAGQLRAQGIDCVITTDDCAGMYPSLGVIQLLVDSEMAEDARRILKETPAAAVLAINLPEETSPAPGKTSPPRVLRFNVGLFVGVILGVLIHISYSRLWQLRDIDARYDYDNDGVPEALEIWKKGELKEVRWDRDSDGRIDAWYYYRDGQVHQEEWDDNFDGKADHSVTYSPRQLYSSAAYDTDFNGVIDVTTTFTNGITKQSDWKPNGTNVILLRQLFGPGGLDEELRDLNGDGWFDVSIKYDPFNTPVRTNSLRPLGMRGL
jgi:hypothetical protein